MHRGTRLLIIAAIGMLIVVSLAWTAFRPAPVPVEVAEVARGPMEVTVDVDGVTRIREVWEVSAPISGTALRSPVREGDRVIADETLVAVVEPVAPSLLDARARSQAQAAVHEAQAALAVAESELRQAEEDLAYAQGNYDRTQALVERGVASIVRMEEAAQALKAREAARDAASSALEMAQGTLERAEAALIGPEAGDEDADACCVRILAPADGVVLSIGRVSERPVTAGERLLAIGDPTDLEIVADPLSRDAVRIPDGARARIERWGGAGQLDARLRRIEPSAYTEVSALGIEEQRVEAIFDLQDAPAERAGLGDGYAVRLHIIVWEAPDALRVPLGALFRRGDEWAVFAVRDGHAVLTPVELGQRNDRIAQVLGGLENGDLVIVHPGEEVSDGSLVDPVDAT